MAREPFIIRLGLYDLENITMDEITFGVPQGSILGSLRFCSM